MDEKIYKITLADGTVIDDLKLNGNNYISKEVIYPEVFNGNCSPIVISDGINNEVHGNMELVQVVEVNGEYWFVLRDISLEELDRIKTRSDIEYIAMMTDVAL
jgi:hypothetical protein